MSKLKVYGGLTMNLRKALPNGNRQARTIVAANSKRRAAELAGVSLYCFNDYWSETGNANELATANCEGVWVNQGNPYHPQWERIA